MSLVLRCLILGFSILLKLWGLMLTTEIPSMAKIAVPKNRGSRSGGANQGTLLESGRGVLKM